MPTHRSQDISTRLTVAGRFAVTSFLLILVAVAAASLSGGRPVAAQAEKSPSTYLVYEVPNHVIDDLVAVQRGTLRWGGDLPIPVPELDLTNKLCGDYQCICIDMDPCEPDSDHLRHDRILIASSVRTRAVLDLVARELTSGKYSSVKLCSTLRSQKVGCVTAS
jgi:hypothetical protein